jgi:hypothetical protein
MERHEVASLLRELVSEGIALPSIAALRENKQGKFDLIINGDCDTQPLREFVAKRNLIVTLNEEKGFCIISRL